MLLDTVFETDRCFIRHLDEVVDKMQLHRILSDEDVVKYTSLRESITVNDTFRFIFNADLRMNCVNNYKVFGVFLKGDNTPTLVGVIVFNGIATDGKIVVFEHFYSRNYWNRGFASEVGKAAMKYWFSEYPHCEAITVYCDVKNEYSRKALHNAGFDELCITYDSNHLSDDGEVILGYNMQILRD